MEKKYTREDCILLLKEKSNQIGSSLKKSDFTNEEVAIIKSFLGPFPRALEIAGIKEVSQKRIEKLEKKKENRIDKKIRQRESKLNNN